MFVTVFLIVTSATIIDPIQFLFKRRQTTIGTDNGVFATLSSYVNICSKIVVFLIMVLGSTSWVIAVAISCLIFRGCC